MNNPTSFNNRPSRLNDIQGLFGEHYRLHRKNKIQQSAYPNIWVFPGTGSAFPGMYQNEFLSHSIFQNHLQIAQKTVPDLKSYFLSPSALNTQAQVKVQNIALFCVEVCLAKALSIKDIRPHAVTGHSFGEYAVLVVSGMLNFQEGLELVCERENISGEPFSLGGMVVAKASPEIAKKLLLDSVTIANFNAPDQVVFAAPIHSLKELEIQLKAQKIAYRRLNSPFPFHSPLMEASAKNLGKFIEKKQWLGRRPRIPFYSSVLHKWITYENASDEDLLGIVRGQLIEPVDFVDQLSACTTKSATNFIEVGPKKVLSSLIRRNLGKSPTISNTSEIFNSDTSLKLPKAPVKQGKSWNVINSIIAKVTGYEIQSISVEDRLQEDLGLDSIKKTEILFSVMEEFSIDPTQDLADVELQQVGDLLNYIETHKGTKRGDQKSKGEPFFLQKEAWLPMPLPLGVGSTKVWDPLYCESICDGIEHAFTSEKKQLVYQFVDREWNSNQLVELFEGIKNKSKKLRELQSEIYLIGKMSPAFRSVGSFIKSIKKEGLFRSVKIIDVDVNYSSSECLSLCEKESLDPWEVDVRLYKGMRSVRRFIKVYAKKSPLEFKRVLIVGATRGVGHVIAKSIGAKKDVDIVVVGRRELSEVEASLDEIKASGATVTYQKIDVSVPFGENVIKLFDGTDKFDLLINSSGVEESELLENSDPQKWSHLFGSKIVASENLNMLARALNVPKVVHFSSIVSSYGNTGQSIYAASNAYIDAKAELYAGAPKESGQNREIISLQWPAWTETGMTARPEIHRHLSLSGVATLSPEEGVNKFYEMLNTQVSGSFVVQTLGDPLFYVAGESEIGLGQVHDDKLIFEENVSLKSHGHLEDHVVNNNVYMPAAEGIVRFLIAQQRISGQLYGIRNFKAKYPVVIGEQPLKVKTVIKYLKNKSIFQLETNKVCFEAEPLKDKPVSRGALERLQCIDEMELETYGPNKLFHGPRFQFLKHVSKFRNSTGAELWEFPLENIGSWKHTGLDHLIQIVDALFQASWVRNAMRAEGVYLPISVDCLKIDIFPEVGKNYSLLMEEGIVERGVLLQDALVLDEQRICHMTLSGLKMKALI